jgi:hypothetical protein
MRMAVLLASVLVLGGLPPAAAEAVFTPAENKVPVALVEVAKSPRYTEVRLQTQAAVAGICWHTQGPDSPYLVASDRRYRFLGGDGIGACPAARNYVARESMALRFEKLDPQIKEFSFVDGQGGEKEMTEPETAKPRFWNFLRVTLK